MINERLIRRLAVFGVESVGHAGRQLPANLARSSFHFSGVTAIVSGVLHYATDVDADDDARYDEVAHEGCHLLVVPRAMRRTMTYGDVASWLGYQCGEAAIMWLQVELQRGIPGRGIRRAIQSMIDIDYGFGSGRMGTYGPRDRTGWRWWRCHHAETAAELAIYGMPTMAEIVAMWRNC